MARFQEAFALNFDLKRVRERMQAGHCLDLGSRTFSWRVQLGVVPEDRAQWVASLRRERAAFYRKTEELRITRSKDLDPRYFNPLAATDGNPWSSHFKDKEVRDLITQDIERTSQEFEFFTQKRVKDILVGILFVWAKDNQDIQYKQGLNEVLAIVVFAFFAERLPAAADLDARPPEEVAASPELLAQCVFDARHTFADIYSTFARILALGVKDLYQETKDISELRKELVRAAA